MKRTRINALLPSSRWRQFSVRSLMVLLFLCGVGLPLWIAGKRKWRLR